MRPISTMQSFLITILSDKECLAEVHTSTACNKVVVFISYRLAVIRRARKYFAIDFQNND